MELFSTFDQGFKKGIFLFLNFYLIKIDFTTRLTKKKMSGRKSVTGVRKP